jgi:outer membrane protein
MKSRIFPAIILGIWLFFGAGSTVQASPAATTAVGFVDFIYLVDHHPDTVQANATLKADQDAAKQEFATKSAGLGDQEKQDLDRQLGQQLEQKRLELVKPISAKVVAAANEVAQEKGLSIVIGKNDVVCGGVDITADVLKKITEK